MEFHIGPNDPRGHAGSQQLHGRESTVDLIKTFIQIKPGSSELFAGKVSMLKEQRCKPPGILGTLARDTGEHLLTGPGLHPGGEVTEPRTRPLPIQARQKQQR